MLSPPPYRGSLVPWHPRTLIPSYPRTPLLPPTLGARLTARRIAPWQTGGSLEWQIEGSYASLVRYAGPDGHADSEV